MNASQNFISSEIALQILLEAEQNGVTVENYLRNIAGEKNGGEPENQPKVRPAKIKTDFAKTHEWLKNHRHEYVGKWIVLDEDKLIGSGENPLPLIEQARTNGVKIPFVQFISENSEPFMGGWL